MINKKKQYLGLLNQQRQRSKFNVIYQSILGDLGIYDKIPGCQIKNRNLKIILEEINQSEYIICQSGRTILLQEAIFMTEQDLITEGILDVVGKKIKELIQKIKQGIKQVLSQASEAIKAFCQKVKNNKVVAAIRKRLGLDQKLKSQNFKKYVKIKAKGKQIAVESIKITKQGVVITEATKLSKKEEAITDQKQIKKQIKKYEDAISGKKELKNKQGKPLSQKYLKAKLKLWQNKLNNNSNSESESDSASATNSTSNSTGGNSNVNVTSGNQSQNQTINNNQSVTNNNDDNNKDKDKDTEKGGEKKQKKQQQVGEIIFDEQGIKQNVSAIKDESLDQKKIEEAGKSSVEELGGQDAAKQLIDGDSEPPKEEQTKQKKGLFSKIKGAVSKAKDKANQISNKVGQKVKEKVKQGLGKAKTWFNSQNKFVKILICCIIAVLAILALYFLITTVLMPLLYGLLHGGVVNAVAGTFKLIAAGKTFVATYKQGKKAWQSGQGWGKFFVLLGMSIMAAVMIGQMASQGADMMAADQAKNAATEAGQQASQSTGQSAAKSTGEQAAMENTNINNALGVDGKPSPIKIAKMIQNGEIKIPADAGKYDVIEQLCENKNFESLYENLSSSRRRAIIQAIQQHMRHMKLGMYNK